MGIWLGENGFLYNWTEWKCKLVIQPLKHRISWDTMMGYFMGYKTSVIFFEYENVVLWFNQSKRWFNGILMGMEWDSDGIPYGNVRVCDKSPFSVMISLEKLDVYGSYGRSPEGNNSGISQWLLLISKQIWLVVWNIFYFSIYWECHHPNWLIFFKGVETTSQKCKSSISRNLLHGHFNNQFNRYRW